MPYFTFTIRIQKKYSNLFIRYMKMFYANWHVASADDVFENTRWDWGESADLFFCFAAPVYSRMYELLYYFIALTKAKMLLNDHSDNPDFNDPAPYLFDPTMSRFGALCRIACQWFLYKKDHLVEEIRTFIRNAKNNRVRNKIKVAVPYTAEDTDDLPF